MDSHVLESMKVTCYKLHLCFLFLKFKFSAQTKVGLLHKNLYSYYKHFTKLFLNKCSTSLTFFSLNELK